MEYEGHNFLLIMPISEEAVERLVKIDEKLLVRLLANTGKTLLKHKDKRQTEEIFFTNYRLLLLAHHKLVCNGVSNNLALHFALLTSHCMIQKNRID